VAVKVINPEFAADSGYLERFRLEAEAAQRVSGAYTAPVLGANPDGKPPWLAIDFVFGPSLDEAVAKGGPLSSAAVWCLAGGLAEALRAVHAQKLVHRDLKPGNVILDASGPKVIDFGIARGLTATGMRSGGLTSPGMSRLRGFDPHDVLMSAVASALAATPAASQWDFAQDWLVGKMLKDVAAAANLRFPVPLKGKDLGHEWI
jgi:serine/threonine protein kinase